MNAYLALCIGGLLIFCAGGLTMLIVVRWALIQRKRLKDFLNDAYHVDLLPEICRVEGLIVVALLELQMNIFPGSAFLAMYLEKALECVRKHKKNVMDSLEKYHEHS